MRGHRSLAFVSLCLFGLSGCVPMIAASALNEAVFHIGRGLETAFDTPATPQEFPGDNQVSTASLETNIENVDTSSKEKTP